MDATGCELAIEPRSRFAERAFVNRRAPARVRVRGEAPRRRDTAVRIPAVEIRASSSGPTRAGGLCRGIVVSAVAVACAGLIAACGSSGSSTTKTYLDVARVERSIRRSIFSQRHLRATVVCPTRVVQKPGNFACIATTYSVKKPHRQIKTPFLVTIQNSRGYVTYIGK